MTRLFRTFLWSAALASAVLLLASPASAGKPCAQQVIDDWYGNGRVDKIYELHCYRDAIRRLPDDVETYSSAPDDIERALQAAIRGAQDPGPSDSGDPEGADGSGSPDGGSGGAGGSSDDGGASDDSEGEGAAPGGSDDEASSGFLSEAIDSIGPSSADSLPLPLLIVAGLAVLLLAAGSAGLVARRIQARRARLDGTAETPPPL